MIKASLILILFVILKAAPTDGELKTVTIDALFVCDMVFNYSSAAGQYNHQNCTYYVPGANKSYTTWAECYAFCCPGLRQPDNSTFNDMPKCL